MSQHPKTITFRAGSKLRTILVRDIEEFYLDTNRTSTHGTCTVSVLFKLYCGDGNLRFKIHRNAKKDQVKKTDRGLQPGEHELKTQNLRSLLELLSELKRVRFIGENEYGRYLKEIEKTLEEYSEWKTEEIGFKLDEELDKFEEDCPDQNPKEVLSNIEELLKLEDEVSIID